MGRPKNTKKGVRKLTKLGKKSLGLTLPIDLIRAFGWREKQKLVIKKVIGGLTIRDARTKKTKRKRK